MSEQLNSLEKVLIIDDSFGKVHIGACLFRGRARIVVADDTGSSKFEPQMLGAQVECGGENIIARALEEEKYRAILLDGNLRLELEGSYWDGAVVARKLREGVYGVINQNTRILSTSSQDGVIPQADGRFSLPQNMNERLFQDYQERARKLLEE